MASDDDYAQLDQAWEALDGGDPERALELTRGVPDDLSETWVLRATASLDLDDLDGARAAAAQAAEVADSDDDAELLCVQAEIALREWDLDSAREKLERVAGRTESPYVLSKLALLADVEGDFGRADRLLRDAQRLDAANFPLPPRLSERELDDCIQRAIAALPANFRSALEKIPVLVEPMPSRALAGDDPEHVPPDVLGLFSGSSLAERSEGDFELPPTIHVFQRNVERSCSDRKELVEQLRVTLYHELGHYFGFDEEGVAELGLE